MTRYIDAASIGFIVALLMPARMNGTTEGFFTLVGAVLAGMWLWRRLISTIEKKEVQSETSQEL